MPRRTDRLHSAAPTADLAQDVIQLLVAMSGRLSQHFAARAAEFDLSTGEAKVLLAIGTVEPQSMRSLSSQLGLDASNLTGVVDRLERRRALTRQGDPTDRRVKTLELTAAGRRLGDDFGRRLRADAAPVQALTVTELRELRRLLRAAMGEETGAEPG